jgi:hypothetical protein
MGDLVSDIDMIHADMLGDTSADNKKGQEAVLPKAEPDAASPVVQQLQAAGAKDVLFVPLYGHDDSTDALCSLLRVEGVNILLDCGWTEGCSLALLEPLKSVAPLVDLVRLFAAH